ncbi:MAG: DNA mismatch repair protein MutS [Gemmataceae bacterium]|nr:DNA mismatch repair protein MutS [Gemmataceae bacterium]
MIITPESEYEQRLQARAVAATELEQRESRAGRCRLVGFFLLIVPAFIFPLFDPWLPVSMAPGAILFITAIFWHRKVVRARANASNAVRYFTHGLDRLHDRWVGKGPAGERFSDPLHPYSGDLDVFGRGSLFQYLCEAHTPNGHDTLAAWLSAPSAPESVHARQTAITEIRASVDLREAFGTLGNPDRPGLKTRALLGWPSEPPVLTGQRGPLLAIVLGILGLASIVAWAGFGTGPSPLLLVAIVEVVFVTRQWQLIREVMRDSQAVLAELQAFLPVLRLVESQRFESPLLKSILERVNAADGRPSSRIASLASLLDAWDSAMRNQFVLPFAFVFMVPMHLVYAIERWRIRDGQRVRDWLDAVGTFEAICSLSAFAYEHPDYPFPELVVDGRVLEAENLAHPLLPASRRIGNDLSISNSPALLLVSGSNMSGKSTLMRAVGLNVVLALAGAPVCARKLRVSTLAVASAMRQADSLHEGVSAFYAEIRRLQAIREWSKGPVPVLFLLDEILRGTNSHDRRVGAEAVIRVLLESSGIGMVSTHDLTLAEIVEQLGQTAANVHFEDQLVDGQIRFDYRLRNGVVPRGNGLVLLRLLGFEV